MSSEKIIHSFRFLGTDTSLKVSAKKGTYLQLATGDLLPVTDGEGTALLHIGDDRLEDELASHGILADEAMPECQIGRDSNFLRSQLPVDNLLVMLDRTTIQDALDCLKGWVTPVGLLDLGVLAFAAVCFDRIVIQPPDIISDDRLLSLLSDTFLVLTYPTREKERFPGQHFADNVLHRVGIPFENGGDTRKTVANEFEVAWSKLLGLERRDVQLTLRYSNFQRSPVNWNGIPASEYIPKLFGAKPDYNLMEFLSVQTIRALFNDGLAGFVGVPYLSSSFRVGVHSIILQRKVETQLLLDKLLASIGPRPIRRNRKSAYVSESSAPFVLGLILNKIDKPEQFWESLREYRTRFEPLRNRIRKDRNEWDGRSGQYLPKLKSDFKAFAGEYADVAEDVVTIGASVATTLATGTKEAGDLARLGIKLLKLVKPAESFYRLYLKVFRPEMHLQLNLAEEAKRPTILVDHAGYVPI